MLTKQDVEYDFSLGVDKDVCVKNVLADHNYFLEELLVYHHYRVHVRKMLLHVYRRSWVMLNILLGNSDAW